MFIEIALVVIVAAALLRLLVKPQPVIKGAMATGPFSNVEGPMTPYFDPPLARVSYGIKPGALVYGWPAKGGVYMLTAASAVEIEFLGYDRFKPCVNWSAEWWESEHAWFDDQREVRPYGPMGKSFLATGWPAGGGVWFLSEDGEVAGSKHAGMLFNAHTMEERCKIIEQLGGSFYANPKDCPDLDLA